MALNCKKNALIVCLAVVAVLSVLYTYELFQAVIHDDAAAEPGTFSDPSLVSVTVLFRHGERSPVYSYKTYPDIYKNDFPEGQGHLTKIGKQHMYQKGKLFRRLYNGFVSDLYLEREILIKSTTIGRTYMSAAMVLTGMYPPKYYQKWSDLETMWQPIPISNDSPDRTAIFCTHQCPYTTQFVRQDYNKTITSENKNQIENLLSYLSQKIGKPIGVEQIHILCDIITSKIKNGLQVPKWIKHKHIKIMESVNTQHLRRMYGDEKLQTLISGPLLKEISFNMGLRSNSSNYNTTRHMYLYAGHDLSLGTMMYVLDNKSTKTPGYGASIHLHLYFDITIGYIVKVFYYDDRNNDEGEELLIPMCGNPCKLKDFIQRINERFSTDWEKECEQVES